MRRLFSPPGLFNSGDGSINQEYFRPSRAAGPLGGGGGGGNSGGAPPAGPPPPPPTSRQWGDRERELLLDGLERHGVGRWREIASAMPPAWDETSVRARAARALGRQNLSAYAGRRLSRAEVAAEAARNRAAGAATGCWKGGVLVEDDRGSVRAHFEAIGRREEAAATGAAAAAAAAAGAAAGAGAATGGGGDAATPNAAAVAEAPARESRSL